VPIPSEISDLVNRLNQELAQVAQDSTEGLNIAQQLLSQFLNNAILIQYLAYFNTTLFFVETSRIQIQNIVETISSAKVTAEEIQEAGEDLSTILGRVLEVKVNASRTKTRLETWS
jgi:hypothetical protein